MSTTAQSIILDTGAIVPASCDQQTDLALLPICMDAYHALASGTVALDTIRQVVDAMRDASAVVSLYTDGKCETAARCLWPSSVSVTKDKNLVTLAYCTLRKEWRTFRLDRMLTVHALTTPDDAEPREQATPAPDPATVAVRLGQAPVTLSHTATLDAADTALLAGAVEDARRPYKAVTAA
jgi:predicted DNA-binding transcriptional regulator YafY